MNPIIIILYLSVKFVFTVTRLSALAVYRLLSCVSFLTMPSIVDIMF